MRRQRARLRAFACMPPDSHATATPQRVQPLGELAVVLLGEDFGRRHQRDLPAALDRLQRGQRGDDRSCRCRRRPAAGAASDRALARSWLISRQTRCCAPVSLNGRRASSAPVSSPVPVSTGAWRARPRAAMRLQRQLLRQQFVELEAPPRRMRALVQRVLRQPVEPRRRRVQEAQCIAEFPQVPPTDDFLGQRLGGERADRPPARARSPCAASPGPVPRSSGRPGSGSRAAAAGRDDLELRMHDLAPEMPFAHLAEDPHPRSGLQRLLLAGIEVEEAQHELRAASELVGAVLEQAHELPPRPELHVGVAHGALGLRGQPGASGGERHQARVVLVAQRQVQDEVLIARNAELDELIGEAAAGLLRLVCRSRPSFSATVRPTLPCPGRPSVPRRGRAPPRPRSARPWAAPRPDRSRGPDTAR